MISYYANLALLILILIFSIIVTLTIHELGHYVFAKIFKVHIKEFSIGIGPVLFSFYLRKKKMIFSFRMILAGAFVMLESDKLKQAYIDDPNARNYNFYLMPRPKGTYSLEKVAYWKQILIMVGGIIFNFFAFGFFLAIFETIFKGQSLAIAKFFKDIFINIGKGFVLYEAWKPGLNTGGGSMGGAGDVIKFSSRTASYQELLTTLISINGATAVFNFIPIAPLDGSKILQYTYQRIAKKEMNEKVWTWTTMIGVVLVIWVSLGSIINLIIVG
ncbi:site-2 protease family protein [Mycoplasma bradburyae]|uniref:Site-2 protease family protein n=1 Tax=Mycoplasma bradburyae TaxID=2963128 RepID=A0AAW6HPV5_9MOLU|nr:site-2 protease family protein [Mycoplasma bradburyae]MDC4163126.1 site-2 protease family protein [Mycoplasma bradburyae]MDC4181735.1 site-2 protease family protein [Mycoplasma bradburyae]MDC4182442.1 site-2 protease family protein [Mycoplasma bradburyae]MDC4183661.1 site-2 protease family protein [Mycoplasma bradburyae]MDC4183908.1 site-2 protease family protein [Mycoplasma bradburyae]